MEDDPKDSVEFKHTTPSSVHTNDRSLCEEAELKICSHKMGARNLIVCIDGTSNQFGANNTNVVELYDLIKKRISDNQRTWYNSGIGTYPRPTGRSLKFYMKAFSHQIDAGVAWSVKRTVLDAYAWLSDNYEEEDCIYLFGFSRGAFQVRVLSAMIEKVGIIYKGNEAQIPFAYAIYTDPGSEPTGPRGEQAAGFKRRFSHQGARVHFVGAWDTVSSIGPFTNRFFPGTTEGMTHVCYFRHALALDERRVKFLPEYAHGAAIAPHRDVANHSQGCSATPTRRCPHTKEVWFAGTHSDIGGGNAENPGMDRSMPPLRWMVFEAQSVGLRTERFGRQLGPNKPIEIKDSLTGGWWYLEVLAIKRFTYTRQRGNRITYKPHLGSKRKIHLNQKIHSSVMLTTKTHGKYTPMAHPPTRMDELSYGHRSYEVSTLPWDEVSFWETLREGGLSECLEPDFYDYAQTAIDTLIVGDHGQVLDQLARSVNGRQAVYEKVIGALRDTDLKLDAKKRLLQFAIDFRGFRSYSDLQLSLSTEIRPLVSDLLESNNEVDKELAQVFVAKFTDFCLLGHSSSVRSVAFSSDGRRIVSGSDDRTVRIWDAETGKPVGEPFRGHSSSVRSVAFSSDGGDVVSGSWDETFRIWDAEMGKPVGKPFRGHTDSIMSVAFSSDGRRVVSGSGDRTVRIWDAETGELVGEPLRGHSRSVRSVAFSPSGRHVVSGSRDRTIRIWDTEIGKAVGEPFQGHTDSVVSVAFSSDGRRVVSGSGDGTVRIWKIWDAEMGEPLWKPLQEPFREHTDSVMSVTFSSDDRRVVSGSGDGIVQIWDAENGEPSGQPLQKRLGKPFRGHTDSVMSVAFSSNGRRVVSGSRDSTVRIWNVEMGKEELS